VTKVVGVFVPHFVRRFVPFHAANLTAGACYDMGTAARTFGMKRN
jgi:hypothetical protein